MDVLLLLFAAENRYIIKNGIDTVRKFNTKLMFLILLILLTAQMSCVIYQRSAASRLSFISPEEDSFRRQQLTEGTLAEILFITRNSSLETGDILTILAARNPSGVLKIPAGFQPSDLVSWKRILMHYNYTGYDKIRRYYSALWNDAVCFPVAEEGMVYENTWMFERTYGGNRGHEGTDVIPPENLPGYYRIISMTDGVVEKTGWLEKGGYRIGIRSPSGGYYYYAHLDSRNQDLQPGDTVEAGTVLGRMGDTGYGPEGTRGKFKVHLHLGIYLNTESGEEISVNPYWVLRYIQKQTENLQ